MSEFTLEAVPAATVATMRRSVPMDGLKDFFDIAFDHVARAVADAGGQVEGAPIAWYHGMPGETIDVSAGFTVAGDVHPTEGGVTLVERPGGQAGVALHVGPYEGLADTWGRLLGWLGEQGLTPGPDMWEEYLDPPAGDPATWRTRVIVLVG